MTPAQAALAGAMDEDKLQQVVIDRANHWGWLVAHFRSARTAAGGWVTPVAADGRGFPDLVMVHPSVGRLLVVELKSQKGKVTPEQQEWLTAVMVVSDQAPGQLVWSAVWRPEHLFDGTVERMLSVREAGGRA